MRFLIAAVLAAAMMSCTEDVEPVEPIEEPIEVVVGRLEAPQNREVDEPDCASIEDDVLRIACEESQMTEQELTLRDLRPAGVPIERIDAEEIRRSMRSRRSTERLYPIAAEAQTDDPVLLLSRITVSEEGWANRTGMEAILQVAGSIRGRTCNPDAHSECEDGEETILSALRRLSRRVSGMARPTRWRQYWTSTLPPGDSEEPSRLWRECGSGPRRRGTCEGRWATYLPKWIDTQEDAEQLLARSYPPRPCRGLAMAWGCSDCGDDLFMRARNQRRTATGRPPFEVLECRAGVQNRIWGIPPETDETVVATSG